MRASSRCLQDAVAAKKKSITCFCIPKLSRFVRIAETIDSFSEGALVVRQARRLSRWLSA